MKTLSSWVYLLAVGMMLTLCTTNCKKTKKDEAYFSAISKYVYAFTSGDVGKNEPIKVRFNASVVSSDMVGKPAAAGVWSLSPSAEGEVTWEDDHTLVFTPKSDWKQGQKYVAKVQLDKLFGDVPKNAGVFEFDFMVRPLSYQVNVDGIYNANPNDMKSQEISGKLIMSDAVDNAGAEKVLTATQNGKVLPITWSHKGTEHSYIITQVARGINRSKVELEWSGKPIGANMGGKRTVEVPSLGEFVALDAKVVQDGENYININFSDPLKPDQDLKGLIVLQGNEGDLRYVINGNFVRLYAPPHAVSGKFNLLIRPGVKNAANASLAQGQQFDNMSFEDLKPAVRLVGRGSILPQEDGGSVLFPFEAVGLNAVNVEVFKIYNSNILQFLQVNDIEGSNELERVGKIILQKKISLNSINPSADNRTWARYAINLQDLIQQDPGAIYQIRLSFRKSYTLSNCGKGTVNFGDDDELSFLGKTDEWGNPVSMFGNYSGIYEFEERNYYYDGEGDGDGDGDGGDDEEEDGYYRYDQRDNPCRKEYYNYQHFAQRNIFVSDYGITMKVGKDKSALAIVTDLKTTKPLSGISLDVYNFQLQKFLTVTTDGNGVANIANLLDKPYIIAANKGDRRGYLRLADGASLSLSNFDVAGVEMQKGMKGYIYGERDVWRPGDSLFLNFVLEDKSNKLPTGHPVAMELMDTRGAVQYRTVTSQSVGGVYAMHCATNPEAPTGTWTAKVTVGGATFTKAIKIETVKPNRLKIDLDFGKTAFYADEDKHVGQLKVNWLHGATGKNLPVKVEMQVSNAKTKFDKYLDYVFDDPARRYSGEPQVIFDGSTNDGGTASIPVTIANINEAPGRLIAKFKIRAFEQGGDFSTDNMAVDVFPFKNFVGISFPSNQWGQKTLDKEKGSDVRFVCLDKNGNAVTNRNLKVGLYRLDWRWWWDGDSYDHSISQYNSATHVGALETANLTTNARGEAVWKVKPSGWGRYMVRVSDPEGGHCAGEYFWSGYPDEMNDQASRNAAAMLPFSADKPKYAVGETIQLKIPASEGGRVLVSLENGERIIDHFWREVKAGDNLITFKADESMAPSLYAHVSLMQPHAQTKNSLPIRMYGVIPLVVENKSTQLKPEIAMADVLKPGKPFEVSIRETGGKACTYTLAIVDEGLLDLTNFKTPNAWDAFNAREALGVTTWDMYDYVLGAYGTQVERIMSIGGDAFNQKSKNAAQISRFKAAVLHVGPFRLEAGKTAKHTLQLDNYVGSVRVMAVMSNPKGAPASYGSADKTCPVRQPLMIMPTLPRVLGPGETLRLPVEVFAMEKNIKSANVKVSESNGLVQVNTTNQSLAFDQPGQKMTYFDLKVGDRTGPAKFTIQAAGSGESSEQTIDIEVRNPNPIVNTVVETIIQANQLWNQTLSNANFTDIEDAIVEISSTPSINLSKHLKYLIQYPHGCVEQTTSSAFPQLYADMITPLSKKQKDKIDKHITAAITKLQNYQCTNGGFGYWPGEVNPDDWSSSYVGHFLLEAKNKGYTVPDRVINAWKDYQTKAAKTWTGTSPNSYWQSYETDMTQAYRLQTLALAGSPALGDMNRLLEKNGMNPTAALMLGNAYATAGKPEIGRQILAKNPYKANTYNYWGYTYGTPLRDKSLQLETAVLLNDMATAQTLVTEIAQSIGNNNSWYNTQEIATSLRAISKYASKQNGNAGLSYTYRIGNGNTSTGDNSKLISTFPVDMNQGKGDLSVKNTGGGPLYVRMVFAGRPKASTESAVASNIAMQVEYQDAKGNAIEVSKLPQGTDFFAKVTLQRTSGSFSFPFKDMALTQIFPGGWEILSSRLSATQASTGNGPIRYQDIRDDRVYTYFDMNRYYYDPKKESERFTYRIQLNAAYRGKYYLPATECEAMYDNRVRALVPGRWVEVI